MSYDHSKLRVLIDSDSGNLGRTDQEVLDWLNTPRSVNKRADIQDVVRYIIEEGIWSAMDNSANGTVQGFKKELDMLGTRLPSVNTNASRFIAAMDVLITAGVLSVDQKQALIDMGSDTMTPLQEARIRKAVLGDVIFARSL